jgi:dipeptidase
MDQIVHCLERGKRSDRLLRDKKGRINARDMMNFLKDHEGYSINKWNPDKQIQTICMHSGPDVLGQSTASYVGHLTKKAAAHWMTGGSTPCLSVYIPFYLGSEIPEAFARGSDRYDETSFWWNHEKFVRRIQQDYPRLAGQVLPEIEDMQNGFLKEAETIRSLETDFTFEEKIRRSEDFTKKCAETVIKKNNEWLESLEKAHPDNKPDNNYIHFLDDLNKAAGIEF